MFIGLHGDTAASGRAVQKADLQQIGLVNVLQRDAFFADGGGKGLQTHRAATEIADDAFQHPSVGAIQTQPVDFQRRQCHIGHMAIHAAAALDLRKVPDTLKDAVGDTGGTAGAPRDLHRTGRLNVYAQNARRAGDNGLQLLGGIKFQPQLHAKAVTKRRGQLSRPGGRADQSEPGQIQTDGAGGRAFADDDIQRIVFHRRIKHLFHTAVEAVDLVDEQHIVFVEIGQQCGQISGFFNGRAGGNADVNPHLVGNDACQRSLAQTGRTVQQHMIQRLGPQFCRLNVDLQIILGLFLTGVFVKQFGAQTALLLVVVGQCGGDDALFLQRFTKFDSHGLPSLKQSFEGRPNDLVGGKADSIHTLQGVHRHGTGIAQYGKRRQCVLHGAAGDSQIGHHDAGRTACRLQLIFGHFVLHFQQDALRQLFSDARCSSQRLFIAGNNTQRQLFGSDGTQNGQCRLGAYARDGDQLLEAGQLLPATKAVQVENALPHVEIGVKSGLLAGFYRPCRGVGGVDGIAHTTCIDDHHSRLDDRNFSRNIIKHSVPLSKTYIYL